MDKLYLFNRGYIESRSLEKVCRMMISVIHPDPGYCSGDIGRVLWHLGGGYKRWTWIRLVAVTCHIRVQDPSKHVKIGSGMFKYYGSHWPHCMGRCELHNRLTVSLLTYHSEHADAYDRNAKSLYISLVLKCGVWWLKVLQINNKIKRGGTNWKKYLCNHRYFVSFSQIIPRVLLW